MILAMSIRLFQHRSMWYVQIDGKRRSLKTKVESEAKVAYTKIKKQYLAGKLSHLTGQCTKTLKEFSDEYVKWAKKVQPHSTYRANKLALDKLKYYAGEKTTLDKISLKHIDIMKADLVKLSPSSVNNYIRHSRVVLNKAKEWGDISVNPLKDAKEIKIPKRNPDFLRSKEMNKFIASISNVHLRRMVVAYLATGRRRQEILKLRRCDIFLEEGRYRVFAKGDVEKWFRINGMFRAVLLSCIPKENDDPNSEARIFPTWSHPDTISHYVKEALVKAGLGRFHLHHLRHTFASHKAMEGKSLKQLQGLLGHEHINATMIYSHLTEDHLGEIGEVNLGPVDLGD